MRRAIVLLGAATFLLPAAACGGDDGGASVEATAAADTSAAAVVTVATTSALTTAPTTAPESTAAQTTAPTASAAPTTGSCPPFGSTEDVSGGPIEPTPPGGPGVGEDIRTGAHPCYERIVVELQGDTGFPEYHVRYVEQLTLGPSDETVDLSGDANLEIVIITWMTYDPGEPDGRAYTGPTDFVPANVTAIRQLRLVEDWEGVMRWGVGLDRERPFRVSVLESPARLVVDVHVPEGLPGSG